MKPPCAETECPLLRGYGDGWAGGEGILPNVTWWFLCSQAECWEKGKPRAALNQGTLVDWFDERPEGSPDS